MVAAKSTADSTTGTLFASASDTSCSPLAVPPPPLPQEEAPRTPPAAPKAPPTTELELARLVLAPEEQVRAQVGAGQQTNQKPERPKVFVGFRVSGAGEKLANGVYLPKRRRRAVGDAGIGASTTLMKSGAPVFEQGLGYSLSRYATTVIIVCPCLNLCFSFAQGGSGCASGEHVRLDHGHRRQQLRSRVLHHNIRRRQLGAVAPLQWVDCIH
jgi:hypothetical protein